MMLLHNTILLSHVTISFHNHRLHFLPILLPLPTSPYNNTLGCSIMKMVALITQTKKYPIRWNTCQINLEVCPF